MGVFGFSLLEVTILTLNHVFEQTIYVYLYFKIIFQNMYLLTIYNRIYILFSLSYISLSLSIILYISRVCVCVLCFSLLKSQFSLSHMDRRERERDKRTHKHIETNCYYLYHNSKRGFFFWNSTHILFFLNSNKIQIYRRKLE